MYLIFINDLMNKLLHSEYSFKINNYSFSCPTAADDMVVTSLSKNGLDELMNICFKNSIEERYFYNANKCKVIVFNDRNPPNTYNRNWKMGSQEVDECEEYTHLGIVCCRTMDSTNIISQACAKIRRTYFSFAEFDIYRETIHPLTCKRLYESLVLPAALYGCEVWNNLTANQILKLERAHRQCIKHMQSLPLQTRTDVALSALGILPI